MEEGGRKAELDVAEGEDGGLGGGDGVRGDVAGFELERAVRGDEREGGAKRREGGTMGW